MLIRLRALVRSQHDRQCQVTLWTHKMELCSEWKIYFIIMYELNSCRPLLYSEPLCFILDKQERNWIAFCGMRRKTLSETLCGFGLSRPELNTMYLISSPSTVFFLSIICYVSTSIIQNLWYNRNITQNPVSGMSDGFGSVSSRQKQLLWSAFQPVLLVIFRHRTLSTVCKLVTAVWIQHRQTENNSGPML